jgi:hypothetical protein
MMPRVVSAVQHRTPTQASSSILFSSPSQNQNGANSDANSSLWPSSYQQIMDVKQEQIEYQLLSPMSSSSPNINGRINGHHGGGTKIIKVTPTTAYRRVGISSGGVTAGGADHQYFSTPITPSTGGTPSSRVYLTPGNSGRVNSSPALLVPKVEARRRLNLDSAPVDRDGFKTPIKGTKRKHDFSSPSPKKCKLL